MAAPSSTPSWIRLLFDRLHPPRTAVEQRVYSQMQSLLVRLLVPMAVINLINGLIYSAAFLQVVEPWKVAVWFTPVALYSLMQALTYTRLSRNKTPQRVSGRFLRKAELSSLVLGLIWGGSTYLFHSENQLANLFICIVIAGMGAGTMSILGPVARVGARFLVGSVAVMLAVNISWNSPFAVEVTLLALSFTAALLIGGARNYGNIYEMIEQGLQSEVAKELLADAIESSNDAFAFYESNGDLMVANARHRD